MVYDLQGESYHYINGEEYGKITEVEKSGITTNLLSYLDYSIKIANTLNQDVSYFQKGVQKEKESELKAHLEVYGGLLNYLKSENAKSDLGQLDLYLKESDFSKIDPINDSERKIIESIYSKSHFPKEGSIFEEIKEGLYSRQFTENKLVNLVKAYSNVLEQSLTRYFDDFDMLMNTKPSSNVNVNESPHAKLVEGAGPETAEKAALDNPYSNPVSRGLEKGVGYTWDTVKAPLRPFGRDVRNSVQAVANSYKTPDIKEAKHLSDWMYQQGKGPSQYQKGIVEGKNELQAAINESDRIVAQGENLGTIIGSAIGFNL